MIKFYPDSTIAIALLDVSIQEALQFCLPCYENTLWHLLSDVKDESEPNNRSGHPLIQKAWWESSTQDQLETGNDNGVVTTHMPEHHRLTKYIGG